MFAYRGRLIVVMDTKPTKKTQERIEQRRQAGVCLLCEKAIYKRGLCSVHYNRFRTALNDPALSDEQRAELEAKAIREGMVGLSNQGRRGVKNEFAGLL